MSRTRVIPTSFAIFLLGEGSWTDDGNYRRTAVRPSFTLLRPPACARGMIRTTNVWTRRAQLARALTRSIASPLLFVFPRVERRSVYFAERGVAIDSEIEATLSSCCCRTRRISVAWPFATTKGQSSCALRRERDTRVISETNIPGTVDRSKWIVSNTVCPVSRGRR